MQPLKQGIAPFTTPGSPPAPATVLLGRSLELSAIQGLLTRADVRLVSLIGPGGVGKTRLALAAQHASADDFTDGACWIPLVGVQDPGLIWAQVATALGVPNPPPDAAAFQVVKRFLEAKSILLVLDNFEQLAEAGPQVAALLQACPQLKILVTSRRPLRVRSEHEYPVRPLGLPSPRASLEAVRDNDAVQLFVQRARAVKGDFALTAANAGVIAQICARLDGLPLALELAASRLRLFTPEGLLNALSVPLEALVRGARDLSDHQQSLRSTLEWSLALLEPRERTLFAQLGVFVGGADLEAVLAVGGADALPSLETLVEHSLVGSQAGRFTTLETIRELAVERLGSDEVAAGAHERHARHFFALCGRAETEIYGANETLWVDRLDLELGNLRAAMTWGLQFDPSLTLLIAFAPYPMWNLRGHNLEAADWIERALAVGSGSPEIRAKALEKLGDYLYAADDLERVTACLLEALELLTALQEFDRAVAVLTRLARCEDTLGRHREAQAYLGRALEIARTHGQLQSVGQLSFALGLNRFATLDFAAARVNIAEALEHALALKAPNTISGCLMALGMIDYLLGDAASARDSLERALQIALEHRNPRRSQGVLMALVTVVAELGEFSRSKTLLEDFRRTNLELDPDDDPLGASWLLAAASIAAYEGQHLRAAKLIGASQHLERDAVAGSRGPTQALIDRFAAPSRRALGAAWDRAVAEGGALTVEAILSAPETTPQRTRDSLSAREFEVVSLVARGLTDAEIADQLGIRARTVSTHLTSVYNKFGVRSRTQAVLEAGRRGLLAIT